MPNSVHGPGIHHIALKTADFDASMKFYMDGLGFTKAYGWGDGDTRAALLNTGDGNYVEVFAGGKPSLESKPTEIGITHIAFRAADTDKMYQKALTAGAASQMEPTNVDIPGDPALSVRIAFVVGPDGVVIEFFHNDVL